MSSLVKPIYTSELQCKVFMKIIKFYCNQMLFYLSESLPITMEQVYCKKLTKTQVNNWLSLVIWKKGYTYLIE
jgi:hypothetical protein